MLVIDSSAVAELLLGRSGADRVASHVLDHQGDLHAPHLLDIEVLSVLRRLVASRHATAERAGDALDDLLDLAIERYPHEVLVSRIWQLRDNFSAYDAAYVALAEAIADGGVPLLTADRRLARAVERHAGTTAIAVV